MAGNSRQIRRLAHRFETWLSTALADITATSAVDIHIDELLGVRKEPHAQLDAALELFQALNVANRGGDLLRGKILMLMIPLQNHEGLDVVAPEWGAVPKQLSRTPPSLYVIQVSAFLQADKAYRYIIPYKVPTLEVPTIATYYQCWRNPDDPDDDGWARDIRSVATTFLER